MLMRIREQKGVIRLIFIALIIVFAASFVIDPDGRLRMADRNVRPAEAAWLARKIAETERAAAAS